MTVTDNYMSKSGGGSYSTKSIDFHEPKQFYVKSCIYEHPKLDEGNVLQFKYQYKIYEVVIGEGNTPMFLITKPFANLPLGHNDLILKHVKKPFEDGYDMPKEELQKAIVKKVFGYQSKPKEGEKDTRKNFDDVMSKNYKEPVFLEQTEPVEKQRLDEYLDTTPPLDFACMIDSFLMNDGWKTDETLRYLYRADLVGMTEGLLKPSEVMIYQPHKIIVTNTKVGKTSLAKICGYVLDKASAPRFLGFATSDSINPGLGNGLMKATYFDEVGSMSQILVDHILNYMEFGETEVAMGKANVKTRGWSELVFHSNPEVPSDEPAQMLIGLNSFLQKFTARADALGSRIACIVFNNGFERAKRIGKISDDEKNKNRMLAESLIKQATPKVEEMLKSPKIREWLDQDIPNYTDEIMLLMDKNPQIPDLLKQLYRSHAQGAFRHIRGFAFKEAVIDSLFYFYWDDKYGFDEDNFIDVCEKNLAKICALNIDSLRKMCDTKIDSSEMAKVFLKNLPVFLRNLVITFAKFHFDMDQKDLVIIEELSDFYEETAKRLKFDDNYTYFSQLKEAIRKKDIIRANIKLSSFGFELYEQNDVLMLHVLPNNQDVLNYVYEKF